jgi:hypothetical protein
MTLKKFLTIIIVLLTMDSNKAWSFTMNNSSKLTFAQDEVKVNVASGFCSRLGLTDDELLTLVGIGLDQFWNQSPTSRLKLVKGSLVSVALDYKTASICQASTNCVPNSTLAVSNDILISCNTNSTNFTSSAILAVTIPNNISGTTIVGSLILINDQASNQFVNKSNAEKASIIAHEIGHAVGLGHSPVTDSLMYYATMDKRVSLGRDDIDGLSYLYPKQQPISGCGTTEENKNPTDWWGGFFIGIILFGMMKYWQKLKVKTS